MLKAGRVCAEELLLSTSLISFASVYLQDLECQQEELGKAHLGDLLPSHEESNGDKKRLRRRLLGGLLQLPPHTDLHDLLGDLELGQMLLLLQ